MMRSGEERGKVTGSKTCRGLGACRGMGVSRGVGVGGVQVYINTNAFVVWQILLLLLAPSIMVLLMEAPTVMGASMQHLRLHSRI